MLLRALDLKLKMLEIEKMLFDQPITQLIMLIIFTTTI